MIQNKVKFILLSLFLIFSTAVYVYAADTASILPPAKTTFFDQNGKPLTSGTIDFYIPGTTTRKATWQDAAETIPNTNPVVLDAAGRALILGSGSYRQIVKDRNNNTVWDQVTASGGSGGSGGAITVGDGLAVGSIIPWSGFTAPLNYAFSYGQELNRTTYSALLGALTLAQSVTCVSGNATLNTVADTTQLNVGAKVEGSCIPANSVIVSKTPSTVTLNNLAVVSTTLIATFFPYGNGNGITTFNVPDYRGVVLPGRCNMGGSSCSVLNNPTYTDPNALYGGGGNQTTTLLTANLPPYTPAGTIISTLINGGNTLYGFITPGPNVGFGGGATGGAQTQITSLLTVASSFTGTAAPGQISTPIRTIQPSKTINYLIKLLPDVNLSIAKCADISDAGTACTANTGTSGHTLGFLDGTNSYSALQTFANVAIAGGSFTGLVSPTNPTDAATKSYVDGLATGLNVLPPSGLATASVLPNTPTYANGASGVGATLTSATNTTLTIDGVSAVLSTVVLVKNQVSGFQNGIYTVTQAGSGAVPWILTRATYFDVVAEMKTGSYTYVTGGATLANTSYTLQSTVVTVGTSSLVWGLFNISGVTSIAGTNGAFTCASTLTCSGNQLAVTAYTAPWVSSQSYLQSTLNTNIVYASDFLGSKTCDGVTNVFTELQAFLTQISVNGPSYKSVTGIFPQGECILDNASSLTLTINSSSVSQPGFPVEYHLIGYGTVLTPAITRATSGLIIARGVLSNHGDEQTGVTVEGLTIKQRNNANALFGFEVSGMPHVKLIRNKVYAGDDNGVHNQTNYIGIYYHQSDRTDPSTGPYYGRIEENSIKGTSVAGNLPVAIAIEGAVNALVIRANSIAQANYGILFANPCSTVNANCAYITSGLVLTENSIESISGSAIRFTTNVPTLSNLTGMQFYGNRFESITVAALDLAQITQQSPYPSTFGPNTYISVGSIISNANGIIINMQDVFAGQAVINPPSLAANATVTVGSATSTGALAGMLCDASTSGDQLGIITTCFVSGANTIAFRNSNPTSGALVPGSMTYLGRAHFKF